MNHYSRIVFTAYWVDAGPSTEVFFLEGHPPETLADIATAETQALSLLRVYCGYTRVTKVTMVGMGYLPHHSDNDETASFGWRVLTAPAEPPAPVEPPAPEEPPVTEPVSPLTPPAPVEPVEPEPATPVDFEPVAPTEPSTPPKTVEPAPMAPMQTDQSIQVTE